MCKQAALLSFLWALMSELLYYFFSWPASFTQNNRKTGRCNDRLKKRYTKTDKQMDTGIFYCKVMWGTSNRNVLTWPRLCSPLHNTAGARTTFPCRKVLVRVWTGSRDFPRWIKFRCRNGKNLESVNAEIGKMFLREDARRVLGGIAWGRNGRLGQCKAVAAGYSDQGFHMQGWLDAILHTCRFRMAGYKAMKLISVMSGHKKLRLYGHWPGQQITMLHIFSIKMAEYAKPRFKIVFQMGLYELNMVTRWAESFEVLNRADPSSKHLAPGGSQMSDVHPAIDVMQLFPEEDIEALLQSLGVERQPVFVYTQ